MLFAVVGDAAKAESIAKTDAERMRVCRDLVRSGQHALAREWSQRLSDKKLHQNALLYVAQEQARLGHSDEVVATVRTFSKELVANAATHMANATLELNTPLAKRREIVEALLPSMTDLGRAVQYRSLSNHLCGAWEFEAARACLKLMDATPMDHENAAFFKASGHVTIAAWHNKFSSTRWTPARRRFQRDLVRELVAHVRALKATTDAKRSELVAFWTHVAQYANPIRDRESADLAYYRSRVLLAAIEDPELRKKAAAGADSVKKNRIEASAPPAK